MRKFLRRSVVSAVLLLSLIALAGCIVAQPSGYGGWYGYGQPYQDPMAVLRWQNMQRGYGYYGGYGYQPYAIVPFGGVGLNFQFGGGHHGGHHR